MEEAQTENKEKKTNVFTNVDGVWSMRRFLAFILILTGIVLGGIALFLKLDWKILLIALGIPFLSAIVLLFFTSWTDIAQVVEKVKK